MSIARHHNEWLSLVPTSGPFLSLPVLMRVFPQGLPAIDPELRKETRLMFEDWEDGRKDRAVRRAWLDFVLRSVLQFPAEAIAEGQAIPPGMEARMSEFGEVLRPDLAIIPPREAQSLKPRLLIQYFDPSQDLEKPLRDKHWKASPATRMTELLHAADVPMGLITNGEHWMLVHAPRGETAGYASWYAPLWFEEPLTFQAFTALLTAQRFFGVADKDTIEALLTQSAQDQQEVTEQLGWQVRKAVEVLIQSFDKIDLDSRRQLLEGVGEKSLYEAALTIMMRLVFLFSAEERGLLLLGDPLYDQHYAVSTLRDQLQEIADKHVEEILDARFDAWSRLLATFRAVYGGVQHEAMRLPPYGGTLFDPDRFPFLEGRKPGTSWRNTPAEPLKVSNRTVLHLLNALQILQAKVPGSSAVEARRLSFRSLDIEQIGHVYEGLLDHTAKRAGEPVLGLKGSKDQEPEIALSKLEELAGSGERGASHPSANEPCLWTEATTDDNNPLLKGMGAGSYSPPEKLIEFIHEETGRSVGAIKRELSGQSPVDEGRLLLACGHDQDLMRRVRPFAPLLRDDTFGCPVVIPTGSVYVTQGSDRRSTGTHYTPRSLTEPIVQHTLEPLVYVGPAEGTPREQWKLKSAREILELKVCDMAMGSGAFLVQTCRYMSERLVEAWENAENEMRGAGTDREARGGERGAGEQNHGNSKLPGVGGVAAEHGPGGALLPGHPIVSQGGNVRIDQPDSAVGQFGASEHSGGSRSQLNQGISQSSEHSTGITARTGDTSVAGATGGIAQSGTNPAAPGTLGTMQPNAVPSPSSLGTEIGLNSRPPVPASRTSLPGQSLFPGFVVLPDGSLSVGDAAERLLPVDSDERLTIARRFVADRCLYGVDINPMAVEMAKLSLWLITLQRDRPFTFLDHALRCGDSLLGVSSFKQIENFSLRAKEGETVQHTFATANLFRYVDEASEKRRALENLPSNDHTQIETKNRLHAEAEAATAKVKALADCLIAFELRGLDGEEYEQQRAIAADRAEVAMRKPLTDFQSYARDQLCGRRTFHWSVMFPEAFRCGGFDAFVGNPPFMGNFKISGVLGDDYRQYLACIIVAGIKGKIDLCTYFFIRAASLVKSNACFGLLATNSIGQGEAREVGLDRFQKRGMTIFRAVPSYKWPGTANLTVSVVWVRRGAWSGISVLDDTPVNGISSFLTPCGAVTGNPHRLAQNIGMAFRGTELRGDGFIIDTGTVESLLSSEPRNRDVLFPYLTGEDVNSQPDQSASRWVINFHDWPLEKAAHYAECLEILRVRVKPYRDTITKQIHEPDFWKFWDKRLESYARIQQLERVLVVSQVSKYFAFAYVPHGLVYSNKLVIFCLPLYCQFAVVSSHFHTEWALFYGSSLETRPLYTPSACFDTFPFPARMLQTPTSVFPTLENVGVAYATHRKAIMLKRSEGLTKTYNRFHDPDEKSEEVVRLRALHVEMDQAVAAAYGWNGLELGHGFHPTKHGVRYTICESARRTVLDRLLALNHQRYEEEVKAGLHDKKTTKSKNSKPKAGSGATLKTDSIKPQQPDLFG